MKLIEQIKTDFKQVNGVYYEEISLPPNKAFEDIYIKLRNAEGRLYNDSEVKELPDVPTGHRYYTEWQIRKKSLRMLIDYLNSKPEPKTILEMGCGNGWLTNKLSEIKNSEVVGLDINVQELEQAVRVFGEKPALLFINADIFKIPWKFDYIMLSGVIAYFNDLKKLLSRLLEKINPGGEIHIIDSPLYKESSDAKARSKEHFENLGVPEMINCYHHHRFDELKEFNYEVLYNPNSFVNRVRRFLNPEGTPFYWIKICAG